MNNTETIISHNNRLTTNNTTLDTIYNKVKNLPEAGGTVEVTLQEKTVSSSTTTQTVTPDSGYDGLSKVTVNAIATATQATPSISVSSSGLITASATQTAGYVSAGTKSATKQLTTKGATTWTPKTTNQTIASGTYLTGVQTIKGDSNLVASNIKSGVSIFGVTGILEESIEEDLSTPLSNQNTAITNQESKIATIISSLQGKASGGGNEIVLQEKNVTPTTSQQNVVADSGYNGLSKVVVGAVTSAIDSDIKATNIRSGVNILGVTGTMEEYVEPNLQSKSVTPKTTAQTITPDSSYDGLSSVSISAVTSSIDSNIKASNIKTGVSILGVTGTLVEGITPNGEISITENGTYDVTNYASASVNIASSGGTDEKTHSILNRTITSFTDNEITYIGNYAFHSCTSLTDVIVNNVTTMGTYVFYGCTKLAHFTAPLLSAVSVFVFYNSGLTSLTLPTATSIGMHAVRSCKSLTTVDLGACTSLAVTAFEGDTLLTTVIIRTPSVCTMANVNVFQNTPIASGTGYIYVNDTLVDSYKSASNWATYASQIKGLSELEG